MANTLRVDVGKRAEELVNVELDFEDRHDRLHLVEVAGGSIDGLWNEFEHEIQVHLVLLWLKRLATRQTQTRLSADTYPLAIVVEEGLELDNVGMSDNAHDLEFTVLLGRVSRESAGGARMWEGGRGEGGKATRNTHLEALVLENSFDGGILTTG